MKRNTIENNFPLKDLLPLIILSLPVIILLAFGFGTLKMILSNHFQILFIIITWILFVLFFVAVKDDKHTRRLILILGIIYFGLTMAVLFL